MNIRTRRRWSVVVGLALAATTATGVAVAAPSFTGDPQALEWYVGDTATVADDDRVAATLALYDIAGNPVTSGTTTDALPAFVGASGDIRANDAFGTLFIHAAKADTAAGAWTGSQATGTTRFSGAGAVTPPAVLTGKPFVKTAGGASLADVVAQTDPASQGEFAGIFELRLRTSSAAAGVGASYASAFVKVTGSTWAVTDTPAVGVSSTTDATVPATAVYGAGFTVTATVTSDPQATGTVQVKKGATVLASGTLANGAVSIPVAGDKLQPGVHDLTVVYLGAGQVAGSQEAASITITKAATASVVATIPAGAKYGTAFAVPVTVTGPAGVTPTGTVQVRYGATVIGSATLAAGKATVTVTGLKLEPGSRSLTAYYAGSAVLEAKASAAKSVVVSKATSKTVGALVAKKIKVTAKGKLKVTVSATGVPGSLLTGKVKVYDGTRLIATVSLTATNAGKKTITLPKLKVGKHKIKAVYSGNTRVGTSKSLVSTLTVVR